MFLQYVKQIVDLAGAHQEFCMVLLTAALALCAFVSCVLAAKNIKAMKENEIEKARPVVTLEIVVELPCYMIRMKNTGLTPARNVSVELTPSVKYCFEKLRGKPIGFLTRIVEFLPPNSVLQTNIGTFTDIEACNPSLVHKGVIRYEDTVGRRYNDAIVLDFSMFKDTLYSGKKTIHDIGVQLEQIQRTLSLFGSGFHKLMVVAQRLEDYREEERLLIEEANRRRKTKTTANKGGNVAASDSEAFDKDIILANEDGSASVTEK